MSVPASLWLDAELNLSLFAELPHCASVTFLPYRSALFMKTTYHLVSHVNSQTKCCLVLSTCAAVTQTCSCVCYAEKCTSFSCKFTLLASDSCSAAGQSHSAAMKPVCIQQPVWRTQRETRSFPQHCCWDALWQSTVNKMNHLLFIVLFLPTNWELEKQEMKIQGSLFIKSDILQSSWCLCSFLDPTLEK